jgi:hypothetical protein
VYESPFAAALRLITPPTCCETNRSMKITKIPGRKKCWMLDRGTVHGKRRRESFYTEVEAKEAMEKYLMNPGIYSRVSTQPLTVEEHKELLRLARKGMLFEIQDWFAAGKGTIRPEGRTGSSLVTATELGFHSLAKVLLDNGQFEEAEMEKALRESCALGHYEIATMLVEHGAPAQKLHFFDLDRRIDPKFIRFMLDRGVDPEVENGFACVLAHTKAPPLLRIYQEYLLKMPCLRTQMALALIKCIEKGDENGVRLLRSHVFDHFERIAPWTRNGNGEETSPAEEAARLDTPNILRELRLQPTFEQLRILLHASCWRSQPETLKYLLQLLHGHSPAEFLNDCDDGTSSILSRVVRCTPQEMWLPKPESRYDEHLEYLRLLFNNGARLGEDCSSPFCIRRELLATRARHAYKVIELLWEHRESCQVAFIKKLVNNPKLRTHLCAYSGGLVTEILKHKSD